MNYKAITEKVIDYFGGKESYLHEITLAKEEYFEKSGKVFEDDTFYESRMASFVEWFTMDRKMVRVGMSPMQYYYEIFADGIDEAESRMLSQLKNSIHSLFVYKGRSTGVVQLQDLFDNQSYDVHEKRRYVGIHRGNIFEARIFMNGDQYMFTETYCLHPEEVADLIIRQVKQKRYPNRRLFLEVVMRFAALRVRYDRYQRVNPRDLYDLSGGRDQ